MWENIYPALGSLITKKFNYITEGYQQGYGSVFAVLFVALNFEIIPCLDLKALLDS